MRLVARAQVTQDHADKRNILLAHCNHGRQVPMPVAIMNSFTSLVTILADVNLQRALLEVGRRAIASITPNYDDIIAAFDRNEYAK